MSSWQSRLLAQATSRTIRPLIARAPITPLTLRGARWAIDRAVAGTGRLPAGTTWRRIELPACGAEFVCPAEPAAVTVLYFHGGGFIAGSARAWRPFVAGLRMPVLSVDYRLAPEHRISDAIGDGLSAYRWLIEHTSTPVVFAGDSAGGGLAISVALRARDEGLPVPDGLAVISPWAELGPARPGPADALLSTARVDRVVRLCGTGPEPSAARADLRGLPPTLVVAGERDLLAADSHLVARRLRDAGVPCELRVWPGQGHAFPLARALPESAAALAAITSFLTTRSRSPCPTPPSGTPSATRSRPPP
ncbi:alpha/beta hydrolase [Amycolatopsis tucumanensis]|uniref:Alpha/beta hydrolase fold domain-containing protein n=1 Tax=Amycolatopsis tucumanensis TaxID=401106 RepID=A0ABP7JB39_9PSEU|nr:alpha/beta hydrolase [Amycolatopsis tucumanensis]